MIVQNIWIDGRASIEQHLELYIEDLFRLSLNDDKNAEKSSSNDDDKHDEAKAAPAADDDEQWTLTLPDTLAGVQFLLHTRVHGKLPNLSLDICRRLATALMHQMQRKEQSWSTKPRLTSTAELAFEIFAGFLEDVHEFQVGVLKN